MSLLRSEHFQLNFSVTNMVENEKQREVQRMI